MVKFGIKLDLTDFLENVRQVMLKAYFGSVPPLKTLRRWDVRLTGGVG